MALRVNWCCMRLRTLYKQLDQLSKDPIPGQFSTPESKTVKYRNLTGFWLLGLCNNYAYVIMLSAAHDILAVDFDANSHNNTATTTPASANSSSKDCNKISTGAILLADVLPSLLIKSIAPFIGLRTFFRVFLVIILAAASFLNVAYSSARWLAFLGVVCASLSSGLGETTLLGYSSYFDRNVISTWSSGTGASGIFGAVSYAALTTAGLSARHTLLLMLVIPVLMGISFFILLVHPKKTDTSEQGTQPLLCSSPLECCDESTAVKTLFIEKVSLIKPLGKYAVPLMLVYLAEYFINQGLLELINFNGIWLTHSEQYRWFQVDYQLGVFLSRSSVNLFTINKLWVLAVMQFVNVAIFLTEVAKPFFPSIWIVLGLVLIEGMLGGGAYVNTYYKMRKEVSQDHLAFSMSFVPVADTFGIAIAGAIALPVHDYFCKIT